MASVIIKRITEKAEQLYNLRRQIEAKEEENRQELETLKAERDAVQALLLDSLKKNDLASIKVSSGDSFIRQSRKSIEIVSPPHALNWAIEHRTVSIDKRLVAQALKDLKDIPAGFEVVESEYINVRKSKPKE
jgi:hypothetical protein